MRERLLYNASLVFFVLVLGLAASTSAFGSATITIQNTIDGPTSGFNDPTPVSPVGGNNGTTLGQQRLIAFQFAASIWGATLNSGPTITIQASWSTTMTCMPNTATLGQAGTIGIRRDFLNAIPGTWYSSALANALSGSDLNVGQPEINAMFNARIGTPGCLENSGWYLGLDGNHGANTDLVTVLLHEFSHGFGFQTFTNTSTGAQAGTPPPGFPTIYDRFLRDNSTGKTWDQMTDAERVASAVNTGNLVWNGPNVVADVPRVLSGPPRLRVNSPQVIAGNYTVGTADFGPPISSAGITANVASTVPLDACSPISNASSVNGKIAFIDRGSCNFTVKVKNAQDAGAAAVIIGNVDSSPNPTIAPGLGGFDSTIVITSFGLNLNDANTFRSQLGAPINASMFRDTTTFSGADGAARALMFAPNPIQGGSSVSHWDSTDVPNQLMEPSINNDLTHNVIAPYDLTLSILRDLGWTGAPPNSSDITSSFVRQHYLDFLNREPDTGGLNFWSDEIDKCTAKFGCIDVKRINVSAAFFLSIEFQETGYLVYRMYKVSFGNLNGGTAPVPVRFAPFLSDTQQIGQGVIVGVGNWQAQLEANKQAFALAFVQRPEFLTAFPNGMSASVFVDQMNTNAGGVLMTQAEKDNLIAILGATPSDVSKRAQVLRQMAENQTLHDAEFNKAFVLMQYFGYLRRNPNDAPDTDFGGFNFWLGKLNQFNGNFIQAEMVKAFITSLEYRQRFGPP